MIKKTRKNDGAAADMDGLRTAFQALPVRARNRLLFDLLATAGVDSLIIDGDNGVIEGSVHDRTVFLKYLKNRVWARETIDFARACFADRNTGSYIDLGANIGMTTIPVARLGTVDCIAVEPGPEMFAYLHRNVQRNGVAARVTLHQAAVTAVDGPVSFELGRDNKGDNRVRASAPKGPDLYDEGMRQTLTVPGRRLDRLIDASTLDGFCVVKMDIQGAEPQAFATGAGVFARADVLLAEYWPYGIERLGGNMADYHKVLADCFPYGALLPDDAAPNSVALLPFDDLLPTLMTVRDQRPIEAIDLVLAKKQMIL